MGRDITIDKELIRTRFTSAIKTYDMEAVVQKECVSHLLHLLSEIQLPKGGNILEIGCGTGLLTQGLSTYVCDQRHLILNDLCPEVEKHLRELLHIPFKFLAGDAEHNQWEQELSLIASSSTIQWWEAPSAFFTKAYLHLRENGYLLFSTFGPDNMKELKSITGQGLSYDTLSEIKKNIESEGFSSVQIYEEYRQLHFPNLLEILRHLRRTGVSGVSLSKVWSPADLRRYERAYKKQFEESKGLPLSYHMIYGIGQKTV